MEKINLVQFQVSFFTRIFTHAMHNCIILLPVGKESYYLINRIKRCDKPDERHASRATTPLARSRPRARSGTRIAQASARATVVQHHPVQAQRKYNPQLNWPDRRGSSSVHQSRREPADRPPCAARRSPFSFKSTKSTSLVCQTSKRRSIVRPIRTARPTGSEWHG